MGKIPLNLHVRYQPAAAPGAVAPGYGMNAQRSAAQVAGQAGAVADTAMQIVTNYAAENRDADQRADNLKWQTERRRVLDETAIKLSETSDPKAAERMAEQAAKTILKTAGGKDENNVHYIRWSDQRSRALDEAKAAGQQLRTMATARVAQIGKLNTNTKSAEAQRSAEMEGDYKGIELAVLPRYLNGTLTAEQYKAEVGAGKTRSDLVQAKNSILKIEAMEPEAAADASATMIEALETKEEDGSWAAFEHLDEATRTQLVKQAKGAAAFAKRRADEERIAAQRAANEAYLDWQLENPDEELTLAQAQEMELPKEFQVRVMRANQKADSDRQSATVSAQTAAELLPEVLAYDAQDDPGFENAQALYLQVHSLPGEYSGFLSKIFSEQYAASKGVPGAKSKAAVLSEIAGFLLADPKKGTAADFHKGRGKGWTDEEAVKQVALEQDRFLTWVKQTNPTDEEMLEYTRKNPRWSALRARRNLETFRSTGTGGSALIDFAPLKLRSTQAGYLPSGHRLLNYSE
jgi:hypothetical protein